MKWQFSLVCAALVGGCYPELALDKGRLGQTGDTVGGGDGSGSGDEGGDPTQCVVYDDADGDGFGDPATEVQLDCEEVSPDQVDNGDDCDDTRDSVYPEAPEQCDDLDNDCDEEVDEDLQFDWYRDSDGDGYGDALDFARTCDPDDGYVADSSDCDDTRDDVYPGADEYCDDADNDCDDEVDEDAIDQTSWYLDTDADGFGDATDVVLSCDPVAGRTEDNTDCDDAEAAVNPAAVEVCDEIDNDCDSDIDDADADLDLSSAPEWYLDADADGLGDAASPTSACVSPSGYVDNDLDCDDSDPSDATDLDADGTPDCSDDDIDGDGLRNEWDADPEDDSVVRGPTEGTGTDGALAVSSNATQVGWTLASAAVSSGATSLTVDDSSIFGAGDEVLLLSQQGVDAGQYQFVFVASVSGSTLNIEPAVTDAYDASSVVLVQRVPHYTSVAISARVRATSWAGAGGGVVVFRATDAVSVSGEIDVEGQGFLGGEGVSGNSSAGTQGGSLGSAGATGTASANDGGGGSYPLSDDGCESGGGGGYGTAGSAGEGEYCSTAYWWGCSTYSASVTDGGGTYGDVNLTEWHLGSGGGAGAPDPESDGSDSRNVSGDGGAGGGLVAIFSGTSITISGQIDADGERGSAGSSWGGEVGGGGGGSGGTVLLAAPSVVIGGRVYARGRDGGEGESYGFQRYNRVDDCAEGGEGGDGRVRIEASSISGTSNINPSPGSTDSYTP